MHEQSETEQDPTTGQWGTVFGRNTLNAGQQIPGTRQFPDIDTALADAKLRSMMENTSPVQQQVQTLPRTPLTSVANPLRAQLQVDDPSSPANAMGQIGQGLAGVARGLGSALTSPLERPVTDEAGYTHYGGTEVPPGGRRATPHERLKTLGDYAGMTLAGRGGMVYDPEPFRKLAAQQTVQGRESAARLRAQGHRGPFGPNFEESAFGTRTGPVRAVRGAAGGQPVDFTRTPLKFSEPAKVKMRGPEHRGDLSTAQEVVQIHADIPGRGPVKIGEIRYTVRDPGPPTAAPGPGSRWAHITHVERQPNVSLHPDELAHIRDAFDQFMRTKGMNAPSTFDYLAMPEMGSAGRLFNWRMNWPQ